MKRFVFFHTLMVLVVSVLITQAALAENQQPSPTPASTPAKPGITGTMNITYNTRMSQNMDDDVPKVGVQDVYTVDLTVNGNNKFAGQITRQPRIKQMKIRTIQWPRYDYSMTVSVDPKRDGKFISVGEWVGPLVVDEKSGAFLLGGDENRVLRMIIRGQPQLFEGVFYGKPDDKSNLSWESIKRTVAGKTIEVKYQADPIRYDGTKLAAGPNTSKYPVVTVTGALDYDRETSNYYAKGLTFNHADGSPADVVTGSIKWNEDPNRKTNGKGKYEFNLRFNEERNKPKMSDAQAFQGKSDDDLFFAVDESIPCLQGTIEYVDQMSGDTVTGSKVTYNLVGTNLTDEQVMGFAKLWLLSVGPTNDE